MCPDAEPDYGDRDGRHRDVLKCGQRSAHEHRQRHRYYSESGENDDIHPRVAERPEKVLPQQRAAAAIGIEEVCAQPPVELEHETGTGERRQREENHGRCAERAPQVDRHAAERHSRRAHAQDCDYEVDRTDGGRHREKDQRDVVEVDVYAGVERPRGERDVVEPSAIRRRADEKAGVEKDAGEQEYPVAEGVEPRVREVARSDEERNEVVAEAGEYRCGIQEHHRRSVHAEELVVRFR